MSIPDPNTIGEFYNTNVVANPQVAEYGKFIQFPNDDSQFPAVSVTRITHPDTSEAFPNNTGATGLTSVDVYPKFGVISYIANSEAFSVTLSAQQVSLNTVPLQQALSALTTINLVNSNTLAALTSISLATELNTFDTLTAVAAFNNNFVAAVPALTSVSIAKPVSTYNNVTNWDVLSAAINASTYTTLPSNPANEITILNNTGGTMYIKNASKSIGLPIDNNTSVDLKLIGNTNEVACLLYTSPSPRD